MIEENKVRERYENVRPDFQIWHDQVLAVLRNDSVILAAAPSGLNGRVKDPGSLIRKIARKHDPNNRPISACNFTHEFTDIAGVRIILRSKSTLRTVCGRMHELEALGYWRIDHIAATIWHPAERILFQHELESFNYPPEHLLYVGRHFIVEPSDARNSEERRLACEVQVRTALEEGVFPICRRIAYNKDNVPQHIVDQLNGAIETVQVLDEAIMRIERSIGDSNS